MMRASEEEGQVRGSEARRHDPLEAFRIPSFTFFAGSRGFWGIAYTLLQATLAWQVYEISGSELQLGVLGLVRFLPAIPSSLLAGAVADTYDRRLVAVAAEAATIACALVLGFATMGGWVSLPFIYGMVVAIGAASAFESPATSALLPTIVPREIFPTAVTVTTAIRQLGFVTGPALAGFLIDGFGVAAAYLAYAAAVSAASILVLSVRVRRFERSGRAVSLQGIVEGLRFVRRQQVVLGAMTLDMFAVIFGGAVALLPVYATDILGVGARGYGLLAASFDVGALLTSLVLVLLPPVRNAGRVLLLSVAVFGLATIVFGLSRNFLLSLFAYLLVGAADQVSVVMRQTAIQLVTPDELRGRVSSVNMIFIGASNQLGAAESGFVAAATNATFAVVSGGAACLAVVGAVAAGMPELRRYRVEPSPSRA